jgi:hypothetical protein
VSRLATLVRLEGRFRFLRERGPWFWGVVAVGAGLRAWFVFGTEGTLDVVVWAGHAWEIRERGLIPYYHGGQYIFNHPPLMGEIFSRLYVLAALWDVPFRVFLRAPFALLDLGTALLLMQLLRMSAYAYARHLLFALYWLFPLAIILSSYHGNTDSALAFFLLAAVVLVARRQPWAAGAAVGIGLWIKFPAVLALPALAFGLVGWRDRTRLVAAACVTGIASYLPALLQDAEIVIRSVFLYPGLQIQSTAGVRVWGSQVFYPEAESLPVAWREGFRGLVRGIYRWNTLICVAAIALVAWARRERRQPLEIAGNVGASYVIFHGLTNFWAFQYLAWAIPLWLVSGWRFALPAALVTNVYVYVLYVWLCESWLFDGRWEWYGKPHWPPAILTLRNAAVLFFFATAWLLIVRDFGGALRRLLRRD